MATPCALDLAGVGRAFPPDVGESAAAIWREMLLPRRWLPRAGAHGWPALEGIDLSVAAGECVGVLGAHRSGKSTLAAIAAGVLAPTAGRVTRPRRCVLVARPTAGFKPGLTVRENLRLLGVLHGLAGDPLERLLESVLACCDVDAFRADAATGNLSPQVVRPLALSLLLALPADLLVVDGLTAAGAGDMRWIMHGRLRERLSGGAALVLSADACFLREVASRVHLLERGRLTGPHGPDDLLGLSAPWSPDEAPAVVEPEVPRPVMPWQLLRVRVDGEDVRHAQASLLWRPGDCVRVTLALRAARRQCYRGGRFELHGGSSGLTVARWDEPAAPTWLQAGACAHLGFDLRVPDAGEDFCGLSFTPAPGDADGPCAPRLKVLVYGVGHRHARAGPPRLDITRLSFEPERTASHAIAPDIPAAPGSAPAPAQGQPAAPQVG